ncbi:hypothetical protein B0H11DRAFT_2230774 [Mycena galericulata]|nr:hypothetical protein B0H11DRAFT_2230774 [Mycena galericulata]
MFTKLSFALALTLSASSALALTINTPGSVTSTETTSITWSSTSSDPVFSIELNHPSFESSELRVCVCAPQNSQFAIANNVNPANDNITVTIPPVPAQDGYTLTFVNVTNINDVFATSNDFAIAAAPSSASSPASSTATGASGVGASTTGASGTGTASGAKSSATAPPSSAGSASASGSAPSTSPSTSGAPALRLRFPSAAYVLVGLVAGAFAF